MNDTLSGLIPLWSWESELFVGTGFCEKAVWSRASRRNRGDTNEKPNDTSELSPENMAFGFKISLEELDIDTQGTKVIIRWLKGHDSVLFESLCGMVKRKLQDL